MQNAGDEHACLWMCFAHAVLCAPVRMCVFVYCVENVCAGWWTCLHVCRSAHMQKCVSVMMGREGFLSFNTVLLEQHWTICECMEQAAETQSSLVHLPTSATPISPVPPPTYLLTDSLCFLWNRGRGTDTVRDICREPYLHHSLFTKHELWTGERGCVWRLINQCMCDTLWVHVVMHLYEMLFQYYLLLLLLLLL